MKRFLPLLLVLFLTGSLQLAQAQCSIYDIEVTNERDVSSSGSEGCNTTIDISFTIENNNGNKFIFIHVWLQPDYPDYFQCVNGENTVKKPPVAADLAAAFATIAIDNNGLAPTLTATYVPDPTVPITTVGSIEKVVNTDGSARITLKGVQLTVPVACGEPFSVVADVWSSQAARAQTVHCATCNIQYASLNVGGLINCNTLQYTIPIENTSPTAFEGNYRIYVDMNDNGELDDDDVRIRNTTSLAIAAESTTTITGTVAAEYAGRDLLIIINQQGAGSMRLVEVVPTTECTILPVDFSLFTATRQNNNVLLNWETAMEENNTGFQVQRNTGAGWKNLAFVTTKAEYGNSTSKLSYGHTDVNTFSGITQYRLQQVDIDGKSKYSEIRAVKGNLQTGRTIIYPNPSSNGSFNIAFDNVSSLKNVYVSDVSGRTLKQWKNVANNLQVTDLAPGVYTLRIVDVQSGVQVAEKVIVNKQ